MGFLVIPLLNFVLDGCNLVLFIPSRNTFLSFLLLSISILLFILLLIFIIIRRNHNVEGATSQEPYAFGQPLINISIAALNTRYTLLPYYYTYVYII